MSPAWPHRPFVPWPDKRLRAPARTVARLTDGIRATRDERIAARQAMPGNGLAGRMYFDGLSKLERDMFLRKGRKRAQCG